MNNTSTTVLRSISTTPAAFAESSAEAMGNNTNNNSNNNNNNNNNNNSNSNISTNTSNREAAASNGVTDANADRPSHQTVRFFFLSGAWNRISRANRVLLVSNLFITFAQV